MKQPGPSKEIIVPQVTPREPTIASNRFAIKLFMVVFVFTAAVLAWLSWSTYDLYAHDTIIERKFGRASELRGTIVHLDEVLTMSARMAVATGDPQWEARYRRFEPQLDKAIKEILKLTPSQPLARTDAANMKLEEMENHAFTLLRENHIEEARTILFSRAYEEQKEIYALGMSTFIEQLHGQLETKQRSERNRAVFSAAAGIVLLALLLFSWLAIIRRMYKARAVLLISITRRKETEEVLRKAHRDLEIRVQKRTSQLTTANTSLKEQISERASAELALRKSEESYRDLFENAQDAIYVHDLNGTYLSGNRAAETLIGYSRDEIIGKDFSALVPPEYADRILASLNSKLGDKGPTTYEIEILAKGGRRVPVEVSSRLISEGGTPVAVQGIARDITERRQAEEALRESEERYRDLFDNAQDTIYVHDLNGTYISANRAAEKLVGYTREEILGKNILDFMEPKSAEQVRANLNTMQDGKELTTYEIEVRAKDGHKVPVEVSSRLIYEKGIAVAVQGMARDITERRRAEQRLTTQFTVTRILAESMNIGEAAPQFLRAICENLGWDVGTFWCVDGGTGLLRCEEFWHSPTVNVSEFELLSRRITFAPGKGLPGRAWQSGEPLWVPDVVADDNFPRMAAAIQEGLHAAIGFPVKPGSEVLGVMEFFSREIRKPDEALLKMVAIVGNQIGQFIERKRAEGELRQQRDFTTAMTSSMGEGVYALDCEGLVTFMNPAAEQMLGWKQAELPQRNMHETIHFQSADGTRVPAEMCPLFAVLRSGKIAKVDDDVFTRRDGVMLPVSYTSSPIISNGHVLGAVLTFHDITERKQLENTLRQSEERYRDVIENANDIIYTLDLSGGFTSLNRAGERISGYTREEALRMNIADVIGPDDAERVRQRITKGVLGAGLPDFELEIFAKDGRSVTLDISSRLILADGVVVGIQGIGRDIYERKRAEEELRAREAQLSEAQRIARMGSWEWDVSANKVTWSDELYRLFGLQPEEFGGTFEASLAPIHPDDRKFVESAILESLRDKVFPQSVFRIIRSDGEVRAIQVSGKVIVDETGSAIRLVGTAQDITERKRVEEALIESDRRFRDLFYDAPVGYHELDIEGRITCVNTTELLMLGYSSEEMIGHHVWEFIGESEIARKTFAEKLAGIKHLRSVERSFRRKDGTLMEVQLDDQMLNDPSGRIIGIRATMQDITERKRIDEELKTSEVRMSEAQGIAHVGSWEFDTITGKVTWSDELWRMFGLNPREIGLSFEEYLAMVHPDDQQLVKSVDEKSRQAKTDFDHHFRIIQPDGTLRVIRGIGRIICNEDGQMVKMTGIDQDITEQKRIEDDLEKARDVALESTRLKSEFLANMSHEIRTPMNGVIGMTGLLLDTDLTPEQRDYTQTINTSAESLMTVINDVLDFSKIEAGKLHFEKLDFDLLPAVESPVELLAERAQMKGIEIASLIESDVPLALRGDAGRLRQVITNLIGNAVKFTEVGGVLLLVSQISNSATSVLLRFAISDTGVGISEEAQRRLFQAFVQADGSTTRRYGGTGLGLAISKQLVGLMGGEIGIESVVGAGSTFWFTARFEKQPIGSVLTTPAKEQLQGVRVLIVDDNETNRRVVQHQIASWGMESTCAASGAEALLILRGEAAADRRFDMAIIDMQMPEMDGMMLARAIKSDAALRSTRLLMLTSLGQRDSCETLRSAGIGRCLGKPVKQSQLFDALAIIMADEIDTPSLAMPVNTTSLRQKRVHSERAPRKGATKQTRILVAEDNPVNQKVALNQLQNLGYAADVVGNGREALQALTNIPYPIVLMDCQMPEMDGYEATAEIRRREKGLSRHTVIIAMTAHALQGERQKCLDAGMDDYLSKPVKPDVLCQKLEQWINPKDESSQRERTSEANLVLDKGKPGVLDLTVLAGLREIQQPGKPDLVTELIDLYLEDTAVQLKALREAVSKNNTKEVQRVAHLLKGSSANIGAGPMATLYGSLEKTEFKNGNGDALLVKLEFEFKRVNKALRAERRRPQELKR